MPNFLSNVDMSNNQLLNVRLQHLASPPSSPLTGIIYYDSANNTIKAYNGSTWKDLFNTSLVTTSTTNGNILVNNVETKVFTLKAADILAQLKTVDTSGYGIKADFLGIYPVRSCDDPYTNYVPVVDKDEGLFIGSAISFTTPLVTSSTSGTYGNDVFQLKATTTRGTGTDIKARLMFNGVDIMYDDEVYATYVGGLKVSDAASGADTTKTNNAIWTANKIKGITDTKAPIASPSFTGVPTAPTASQNTNTTQLATTAFVINQASSTAPSSLSSSAAVGTSTTFARADHVHPTAGLMTTSHVANSITGFGYSEPPAVSSGTTGSAGSSSLVARADHSHDLGVHTHTSTDNGGLLDHGALTGLGDDDHTIYVKADGGRSFTAPISGVNPTLDAHLATKAYVDSAVLGLSDVKKECRVATTGSNITLSGGAPSSLDGVTLAAGDRVLVKDQTTASENGIYTISTLGTGSNGTWVRAVDFDGNPSGEVTSGAFVFVTSGTLNGGNGWLLITEGAINVGTTSLSFAQFSGAGEVVAGNGLSKSGNTLSVTVVNNGIRSGYTATSPSEASVYTALAGKVDTTSVVTSATANKILQLDSNGKLPASITGNADGSASRLATARTISLSGDATGSTTFDGSADKGITVTLANSGVSAGTYSTVTVDSKGRVTGGSNPTTLAGYGITDAVKKVPFNVGDGSTKAFTLTHNLNTTDVTITVREVATGSVVFVDASVVNANSISLTFGATAPTSNQYRCVVMG